MSGQPTEAEIQTQWQNAVKLLESVRAFADDNIVGAGNVMDALLQSLEGTYTPQGLANFAQKVRSGLSSVVSVAIAREALTSILWEYGPYIEDGGGFRDPATLSAALYDYFVANGLTVQSRDISYDVTPTAGATNVGNGTVSRLTVDANGYNCEDCTVETKLWKCIRDQNSGEREHAEIFEVMGAAESPDALQRAQFGSGLSEMKQVRSHHAGSTLGGSLLKNSSFSNFNALSTPKYTGWTEAAGGSNLAQDSTNYYRSHPGATVNASLRINGGGGTVTIKQTMQSMSVAQLDPASPYFLRAMVNKTVGTAAGGTFTIRLGRSTASVAIASLAAGWNELHIAFDEDCWFQNFNENPFDVEIEWSSSTSGFLLVDDVLFAPWDLIDGTFWFLRGNAATHTSWLVDDTLEFTDTGGAPEDAIMQWWFGIAGLGYLPSTTSTPTVEDPV